MKHTAAAALAACLFASGMGSAIAQTAPTPLPSSAGAALPAALPNASAQPGGMTQGQVAPATVGGVLAPADRHFAIAAAQGGTAEVQEATLAQQRTRSSSVRAFAQRMIADHTKANTKLAAIAKTKNLMLPLDTGAMYKAQLAKLESLNGAAFNSTYLKMQQTNHQAMADLMKSEISTGKDADLVLFAKQTLPTVERHLTMAVAAMSNRRTTTKM